MSEQESLSDIFIQTLQQAIDGVVVINSQNQVILFNQAAEQLWGYSKEDVLGQNVKVLVPDHIKPQHDHFVNANRETGVNKIVGSSRDIEIIRKDGESRWANFSLSKVEVGDKILYTAFVKDVTQQVQDRKYLEMLSLVTDKTDNAIFITDADWRVVYANKGFKQILGFDESEIIGRAPSSVIAPHFDEQRLQASRAAIKSGQSIKSEELLKSKCGRKAWCSVMSNPVFDEHGQFKNMVTILSEITASKLHQVIHSKVLASIANDEPLEVIMDAACGEASAIDLGLYPAIFKVDANRRLQLLAAPKLPPSYKKALNDIAIGEGVASSGTAAFRGEPVCVANIETDELWASHKHYMLAEGFRSCCAVPIKDSQDEVIGVIAFSRKEYESSSELDNVLFNILSPICSLAIEREAQQQNIRQLAYYDSLTKLPNRSLLHAKAERALHDMEIANCPLAVLFIDLDRFKQVNDTLGHPAGDRLLKHIAHNLQDTCQSGEVYGRLAGDEFVVVAPNLQGNALSSFIEDIKGALSTPFHYNGELLHPSASIGVSVFPEDGHDVGTLIHRADMAMYQAKSAGKGRFAFFSHELNQLAQEKQELESELQKAIREKRLELVYQPQIRIQDGSLYGVEALARWNHPKFGAVSPGQFIPLAEECGLIGDLSQWSLSCACEQMAQWRRKGVPIPTVSVNLSPNNFHNLGLCDQIMSTLRHYELQPSDITLELTENVLMDTNPTTLKVLHDIHACGVSFSIDDFGTGYSSLSYLRKIPIKELKLDRSFVTELEFDSKSRALSRAVIQIGNSLELDVVAEGVEDHAQLQVLREQGYHVAQGYLFSKPLNPVEIELWVANTVQALAAQPL
ncbi:Oxygen sensor protein DosP [Marinomonas aquimarina]|uniref:cyclic-guanylate-specific phosphodiesterase n=1 Tax=Marinomonas aquimarina TaxID=295068 RepID=A0A1A8T681_9GAMM|nr:EAL domain-containing protein [Marinomonas aquimarina]SBS27644.1 Oxygen sensor protein DosP [Marinomonas aquimarina]